MPNLIGATVNASGTKVATAKALGSGKLDTSDPKNDTHTIIKHGNQEMTVQNAINMGILQRNAAGVLVELDTPKAVTRVNS